MKKQNINPDKISGINPIEKDYRYGDSFTRNIREAHITITSSGNTISRGNSGKNTLLPYLTAFNTITYFPADKYSFGDTLEENVNIIYDRYLIIRTERVMKSALIAERYGLKGMIKDTSYLLPSNPIHGKSNMAGNINHLRQLSKSIPKIDVEKWEQIKKEVRPDTFEEDTSLLAKLYNPQLIEELVSYNPHLDTIPGLKLYKDIILKELKSKSVDIRFRLVGDEPYIRINNNIDLTINDPIMVNKLKHLLIKSMM